MVLPKRAIIFDFDGTLADTLPAIVAISNRLATEFGYRQVQEEDIETLRGQRSREVLRTLRVPLFKVPTIAQRFKSELHKEIHLIVPFPSIRTVIEQLRHDYVLGIVTSNSVANVNRFLEVNELSYFSFVRSSVGLFRKSRVLNRVIRENQLSKANTLYVGDEVRDVEAARVCGIDSVAVAWGANTIDKLAQVQPRFIIRRPEELLTIIANW